MTYAASLINLLHVYSISTGFNGYSVAGGVLSISHSYYEDGLYKALNDAVDFISYTYFASVVSNAHPYVGFGYSIGLMIYSGYNRLAA